MSERCQSLYEVGIFLFPGPRGDTPVPAPVTLHGGGGRGGTPSQEGARGGAGAGPTIHARIGLLQLVSQPLPKHQREGESRQQGRRRYRDVGRSGGKAL